MGKIRGLEQLESLRDQIPKRAAPLQERDPASALVDGLFDLYKECQRCKPVRLPYAVQDQVKRVTFLMGNFERNAKR